MEHTTFMPLLCDGMMRSEVETVGGLAKGCSDPSHDQGDSWCKGGDPGYLGEVACLPQQTCGSDRRAAFGPQAGIATHSATDDFSETRSRRHRIGTEELSEPCVLSDARHRVSDEESSHPCGHSDARVVKCLDMAVASACMEVSSKLAQVQWRLAGCDQQTEVPWARNAAPEFVSSTGTQGRCLVAEATLQLSIDALGKLSDQVSSLQTRVLELASRPVAEVAGMRSARLGAVTPPQSRSSAADPVLCATKVDDVALQCLRQLDAAAKAPPNASNTLWVELSPQRTSWDRLGFFDMSHAPSTARSVIASLVTSRRGSSSTHDAGHAVKTHVQPSVLEQKRLFQPSVVGFCMLACSGLNCILALQRLSIHA